MKDRLKYIDIVRGIGILLVILGHELTWEDPLRYYIYCFHIPLFFVITGYVSSINKNTGKFFTYIRRQIRSILVPYVIASIIYTAVDGIKCIIYSGNIIKIMGKDILLCISGYGINVLWFLSALFGGKILLYFYNKIRKDSVKIITTIASIAIGLLLIWVLSITNFNNDNIYIKYGQYFIIAIARPFVILPYMIFGELLYGLFVKENNQFITKILSILSLLFIIGGISRWKVTLIVLESNPIWVAYFVGGLTSIGIISLCRELDIGSKECFFTWWGRNSMIVMITHEYLGIRALFQELYGEYFSYRLTIIASFISILIAEYFMVQYVFIPINKLLIARRENKQIE